VPVPRLRPAMGPVWEADEAQQRALARAGPAADRHALAGPDGEVDALENGSWLALAPQRLRHTMQFDERWRHPNLTGGPFGSPSPAGPGGRLGPGTATVSSPVRPDLISMTAPSLRPSSTSTVWRDPSGRRTSTFPLPCDPATA